MSARPRSATAGTTSLGHAGDGWSGEARDPRLRAAWAELPARVDALQPAPLPWRVARVLSPRARVVRGQLAASFGRVLDTGRLRRLEMAVYDHLWKLVRELAAGRPGHGAASPTATRIEGLEIAVRAADPALGILILTGHLGNFEVATTAGLAAFPELRDRFCVLRRRLRPGALDAFVTRRFERAGIRVLPPQGALGAVQERLAARDAVAFVLDQHAGGRDGVQVDFLGRPAWTHRSLATLALRTGAPVLPMWTWREPDGTHVLRFEEVLPSLDDGRMPATELIEATTRQYNRVLERAILLHPEQWFWLHRRWKEL